MKEDFDRLAEFFETWKALKREQHKIVLKMDNRTNGGTDKPVDQALKL